MNLCRPISNLRSFNLISDHTLTVQIYFYRVIFLVWFCSTDDDSTVVKKCRKIKITEYCHRGDKSMISPSSSLSLHELYELRRILFWIKIKSM